MVDRIAAIREAQAAAIREVERHQLDPSEPVDVFGIVESYRVWLAFLPLDRLYGLYVNQPDSPGIGIHSGHPVSTQRFTAAHEFGHYLLGHKSVGDTRTEVFGQRSEVAELQAQAFASEFVMPIGHVNAAKRRLGAHNDSHLDWQSIYALSLELATSFEATAVRADQLRISAHARGSERPQPKSLKQTLLDGVPLPTPWADVWKVDPDTVRTLRPNVGDVILLALPESPSTGYRWQLQLPGDTLRVVEDLTIAATGPDTHERRLYLRVLEEGNTLIGATLRRAWEDAPIDAFGCQVRASGGYGRTGVRAQVAEAHAMRHAA